MKVITTVVGSLQTNCYLLIDEEKELCTLVTCTPYGINSHRLLVRGVRVETPEDAAMWTLVYEPEIKVTPHK